MSANPGRVHLEQLPAYSPELNTAELLWSHLKRSLKNTIFTTLADLVEAIKIQLTELNKKPILLKAFFNKKDIAFFTD
ncbi:transposase and inactivated derivatives-like protein [Fibrisoma limi BUZ 3]|uniref:Transposase and inactivated derivatives-like protein n=1 Tax=Fibrisoma limi BUZ 3 TaxID=1185876 RepID=I2GRK9_9BACT|nr:transposase and inactivated derivatives-like protein [Fibrisoma limi BUZ 3]